MPALQNWLARPTNWRVAGTSGGSLSGGVGLSVSGGVMNLRLERPGQQMVLRGTGLSVGAGVNPLNVADLSVSFAEMPSTGIGSVYRGAVEPCRVGAARGLGLSGDDERESDGDVHWDVRRGDARAHPDRDRRRRHGNRGLPHEDPRIVRKLSVPARENLALQRATVRSAAPDTTNAAH